MASAFIRYGRSDIHYLYYGKGAVNIVCLHGYGESAKSFAFLPEYLPAEYCLIAIDLPFHGTTQWKEERAFTIADMESILHEIFKALRIRDDVFIMIGYSMGGRIAMSILEYIPQRVSRLHANLSVAASTFINASGSYPIAISFFEKAGNDQIQVYWSGPGFSRQLIPNEAFSGNSSLVFNSENKIVATERSELNARLDAGISQVVTAYPNPFWQTLDIQFYNNNRNNNISAGLYDQTGKLIHSENFKSIPSGANKLRINLKDHQNMSSGIYFLKVEVNGIPNKVLKLVKSKG